MSASPLYRDTFALCGVLFEELDPETPFESLNWHLQGGALRLLDHVTLALGGFELGEHLHGADAELATLRAHLHLAHELHVLPEESFLALAEQADAIGRQIGGWLRKLRRG